VETGLRDFNALLARARSEYLEMPGLSMTLAQASRLWATTPEVADALLAALAGSRFLLRRQDGTFVRAWEGARGDSQPKPPPPLCHNFPS
jgi:hypothetical protein